MKKLIGFMLLLVAQSAMATEQLYKLACGQDVSTEARNYTIVEVCLATNQLTGFVPSHVVVEYFQAQKKQFFTATIQRVERWDLGQNKIAFKYVAQSVNGFELIAWDYRGMDEESKEPAFFSLTPGLRFTVDKFNYNF